DRLAFKARVTDEVVRAEIRKAAVQKQTTLTAREMPGFGQVTKAEKGLIWWIVQRPEGAIEALNMLEAADLEGLASRSVLDLALQLNDDKGLSPSRLFERLNVVEAQLVTGIASESEPPVHDARGCALDIKRLGCEREYALLQREIDRLQQVR